MTFVRDHCLDCHDGPSSEAGFEIAAMLDSAHATSWNDPKFMDRWVRIFDRVEQNEMPPPEASEKGYHSLSPHGQDDLELEQLAIVEQAIVVQWGEFLRRLSNMEQSDGSLLDETTVLLTSNLGNASDHDNRNMPVLIGGGGFRHAGHLAFDRKKNYPLTNLFVSVAQKCGVETDSFSSGTSTMTGLLTGSTWRLASLHFLKN